MRLCETTGQHQYVSHCLASEIHRHHGHLQTPILHNGQSELMLHFIRMTNVLFDGDHALRTGHQTQLRVTLLEETQRAPVER